MLSPSPPVTVCGSEIATAYLAMLPRLTAYLQSAFGRFQPEQREDALQETVASAFVAFARLCERNRSRFGVPRSLARYAVAHWFAGRRVGSSLNGNDVLSVYAQRRNHVRVDQLDPDEESGDAWRASLIADRQTPFQIRSGSASTFRCGWLNSHRETVRSPQRWPKGTPPAKSLNDSCCRQAACLNCDASSAIRGGSFTVNWICRMSRTAKRPGELWS